MHDAENSRVGFARLRGCTANVLCQHMAKISAPVTTEAHLHKSNAAADPFDDIVVNSTIEALQGKISGRFLLASLLVIFSVLGGVWVLYHKRSSRREYQQIGDSGLEQDI